MDYSNALVMLVDDNPQNLKVLAMHLEQIHCELQICTSGQEALDALNYDLPDLILLDVMMPGLDGYAVCRQIRNTPQFCHIPIVFITAKANDEAIEQGFDAGGDDYIIKPFSSKELMARVKHQLELKFNRDAITAQNAALAKANAELHKAKTLIEQKNEQLETLNLKLAHASQTDPLTNLFNRRAMMTKLEEEAARHKRKKRPYALIMADIDYFKKVNDHYGHDCGDMVLRQVAQMMATSLRLEDSVARWGGEEFMILLPETDAIGAENYANRLRMQIEGQTFSYRDHLFSITMTFGIAIAQNDSLDKTIIRADTALYAGKEAGRNRVYIHSATI